MSDNKTAICLNAGEGAAYSAVGDVYRVLASGEQTGGVHALSEIRVSPQNGPPPHIHTREDESFFVLEGEITFMLGDKKNHRRTRHVRARPARHSAYIQEHRHICGAGAGAGDATGI